MSTLREAAPLSHAGQRRAVSVEQVYPATPKAVPQARHLVAAVLTGWGLAAMRDVAVLVTAELTANAAGQGELAPPPEVLVRVSRTARCVVIAAGDHNPAGPPAPPRTAAAAAEHGRGLLIVRALSARLGWCRDGEWKVVWAELPKPQATEKPQAAEEPQATEEPQQQAIRSELGRAA
jgi:hypothetical protein